MDYTSIIKSLGLSEMQAKIYLTLLKLGESLMAQLARESGLKRSTTYLIVEELQVMGLISETKKGKRRVYSSIHPRRLLELARFREKQIEEVLPELAALYNTPKSKPKIQIFEGENGVKLVYQELIQSLNNKQEAIWITNIDALLKYAPYAAIEYKRMVRAVSNPKIRELNYGDEEARRWAEELKRIQGKNHFIRLLPTDYEYGFTDNLIFGNKLVIFSLKQDVFVTVIESEEVVKTYKALFEWAWKHGKEL